jgi:Nitroreductase family
MKQIFNDIIQKATKAPSGHNTQPWKFKVVGNTISIFPDYSRALPVVDADNHALFISLGCALENLIIAAKHYGFATDIALFPSDEKEACIRVTLTENPLSSDGKLFNAIEKRQSTRAAYDSKLIPDTTLQQLEKAAQQEDVEMYVFSTNEEKAQLLPFIEEGVLLQFHNKDFVNELINWVRFNTSTAEEKADGLYSKSMGSPSVPTWFGKLFIKMTGAKSEASKTTSLAMGSSALLLFVAKTNTKKAWVNVGRSFERVVLTATSLNLKNAHVNMPCEEVSVRRKLQTLLKLGDKQPMLLIRMGYSEPMPNSFRRPLADVMINN